MILRCYSVYDSALGAYMPVFYARSQGEAMRSFVEACRPDGRKEFLTSPGDYTLMFLGLFDDESGGFNLPPSPEKVLTAQEAVQLGKAE